MIMQRLILLSINTEAQGDADVNDKSDFQKQVFQIAHALSSKLSVYSFADFRSPLKVFSKDSLFHLLCPAIFADALFGLNRCMISNDSFESLIFQSGANQKGQSNPLNGSPSSVTSFHF